MVVELKLADFFQMMCQLLAYLVQAYEISGCRLGLLLSGGRFTRYLLLESQLVMMETSESSLWESTMTLMEIRMKFNLRKDYLVHCLGDANELTLDLAEVKLLLSHLVAAVELLADLPFKDVNISKLKGASSITVDRTQSSFTDHDFAGLQLLADPGADPGQDHDPSVPERYTVIWGARHVKDPTLTDACEEAFSELGMQMRSYLQRKRPRSPGITQPHEDDDPRDRDPSNVGRGGGGGNTGNSNNPNLATESKQENPSHTTEPSGGDPSYHVSIQLHREDVGQARLTLR